MPNIIHDGTPNNYLVFPSEIKRVEPAQTEFTFERVLRKVQDVSAAVFSLINRALAFLPSNDPVAEARNEVFGEENMIVASRNRAKVSEAHKYSQLGPTLNPEGQKVLESYGMSNTGPISPVFEDGGKCMGGVTHFISDFEYQGRSVTKTAQKFAGGVPYEGCLNQEIYKVERDSPEEQSSLEQQIFAIVHNEKIEGFEGYTPKNNPEHKIILEETKWLIKKGFNPETTNFVEHIELIYGEDLSPANRLAIKRGCGNIIPPEQQAIAEINGLEIISTDLAPDMILDQIDSLSPGAYELGLPATNRFGQVLGHHAIAFIKGIRSVGGQFS